MEIVASTFGLGCQLYIGNTGTQGTALAVIISHVESCTKLKELMVFSPFTPVFGFTLNVILLEQPRDLPIRTAMACDALEGVGDLVGGLVGC
jgi:hypothetical protein